MANPDRLTGLDTSFLHLEAGGAHMHVASCLVFRGDPPPYDDLIAHLEARLHLVPRYRQKLADVPFGQGRPVWADDPCFNLGYHVRHTALPSPGTEEELKLLASRVFAQRLDRSKPLWELWMAEGLEGGRFALLAKTHHALVDGVSGVDITTVLFDLSADADAPAPPPDPWLPRPVPTPAQRLGEALLERATVPGEIARGVRATLRAPRQVAGALRDSLVGIGAFAWAGLSPAPPSPFNVPIGPHRRFTWVRGDLDQFKAIKDALGGTVNDVVLAAVSGALGRFLRRRGQPTEGLELIAMVPVSIRAELERGALGNRVSAMWAPLPVHAVDPRERFDLVREAMGDLKQSGQAVGAEVLTQLSGFAPPTVLSQAARLQSRQRFFNLVVTNVPGPQFELFLLGRPLESSFPMVPLARNQALGIAIMSYHGQINFGLNADYDALPDLDDLAEDLDASIEELAVAAGLTKSRSRRRPAASKPRPRQPSSA